MDEIRALTRAELDPEGLADGHGQRPEAGPSPNVQRQRPLLDESTLCVIWKGRRLHLGHTLAFRLLARLARRPKRFGPRGYLTDYALLTRFFVEA